MKKGSPGLNQCQQRLRPRGTWEGRQGLSGLLAVLVLLEEEGLRRE